MKRGRFSAVSLGRVGISRVWLGAAVLFLLLPTLAGCSTPGDEFFTDAQTEVDRVALGDVEEIQADSTRLLYGSQEVDVYVGRPSDYPSGVCVLVDAHDPAEGLSAACTADSAATHWGGFGLQTPSYEVKLVTADYVARDDDSRLERVAPNVLLRATG